MQVDPDRLDELARLLKRLNLNMEDSIPGLVEEVRRKIDEIRYNYPESSVRSALYVVEEQLNDIFARSLSIYEHLNAKEKLLRDAANQYRETERKSVALLQKAARYTLNGLFPFLATSKGTGTSSPASTGYPVMMGWQDLLKNAVQTATAIFSEMTLGQRLAHVKEDARISGLFQQLNSGSWDEQVRAREELENIAAAFDKIARIQHEYAVYKAYGNKNYMALAHQEAQQQRNILNGLGVSELWYGPAVNLSTYYKGSPLDACRYNPLKSDYSPMPTEDELRMAIAIGWVNPLQREWAKRIYTQTEAALLKRASLSEADRLLQDAIDFYNEKRKGNEDDFHTYNVAVKMAIGVHHDDPDEVGSLAYWQQQNLTDERKREIAYLILNSGTDEAIAGSFASLYTNYAEHQAEMRGGYGDGVGFPVFGQRRSPLEMPGAQKFTEPQEPKRPLTPSKQGELDRPKAQGEVSGNGGTGQALKVPQGLTQAQFDKVSSMIREKVGHISDDIVVQGSRAKGTAKPTSDIDIAIRVPSEKFDELVQSSFSKVKPPNPGSAKEKTMLHAIETGKIQSGEAKLSKFREQLQQELGMDVDISIIKIGGPFDNPPFTPLK